MSGHSFEDDLRTAGGLLLIPAATFACGGAAIVTSLLGSERLPESITRAWARSVIATVGIRLATEVHPELDPAQRYIFVSNHQSHVDVPAMILAWPGPIRFVAKKSLFAVPVFGHALRSLGHVPVDRSRSEQAHASLAQALEPLRTRVSILFFAEGTRSGNGELGRFKKGAAAMAEASGASVVPVGVVGTRNILAKNSLYFRGGPVGISMGAPMPGMSDTSVPREERLARLREAVAAQMERAARLATSPQ